MQKRKIKTKKYISHTKFQREGKSDTSNHCIQTGHGIKDEHFNYRMMLDTKTTKRFGMNFQIFQRKGVRSK